MPSTLILASSTTRRLSNSVTLLATLAVPAFNGVPAQAPVFAPGGRQVVLLDFSTFPLGPISTTEQTRTGISNLKGQLEVVMKDGVPMLRASTPSTFLVGIPETLPSDFSLEFDLIPKNCCNPQDLAFEGAAEILQDARSAHVLWHRDHQQVIGGIVNERYDKPMPPSLSAVLPGAMTKIAVSLAGQTLRMFTNDLPVYSLERVFKRGRVLRVFLGGQNEQQHGRDEPVYLARMRVAVGAPLTVATNQSALSGTDLTSSINNSTPQEVGTTQRSPGTVAGTTTSTVTSPAAPGNTTGTVRTSSSTSPALTAATPPLTSPQNPLPNVNDKPLAESSTSDAAGNVPTAPANFKGTALDLHLMLQWAPVTGAASYRVSRKEAGSPAAGELLPYRVDFPNGVPGATTGLTIVDPHLVPNVDMTYVVEAVFANGTSSPPSATLTLRTPAFLATGSTRARVLKDVVGNPGRLTELRNAMGSTVTWTWDAVSSHFGYGIAIDVVPNVGLGATERVRTFLLTPPISDQMVGVSQSLTTWSRAIPANSTVYFCLSRWRLDHPATDVSDLRQLFPSGSTPDFQNDTITCRRTIVP
jgi:hypothetical protein